MMLVIVSCIIKKNILNLREYTRENTKSFHNTIFYTLILNFYHFNK
jgi:hypothetical protein